MSASARDAWTLAWRCARETVRDLGPRALVHFANDSFCCSTEARTAILARLYPCDRLAFGPITISGRTS